MNPEHVDLPSTDEDVINMELGNEDPRAEKKRPHSDSEGFVQPPPNKVLKPRRKVDNGTASTSVSNRFQVLATNEDRRPPPIIVKPAISQPSVKRMMAMIKVREYFINNSAKETRLYVSNEQDHTKVTEMLLQDKDVEFHTFAPRGTKRSKKFVIHGFDLDSDMETITDALKRRLPGFKMARRLKRTNKAGKTYETEEIQLITEHTVKLEDIQRLEAIDYVRFRVRVYKETKAPVQCRNCQEFGHTMQYCGRTCHCAWCGEQHLNTECPKRAPAKCWNCSGNHPAFSKECPSRQKLMETRKKQGSATSTMRNPAKPVRKDLSFSNVIGGTSNQLQQPTASHHQTQNSPTPAITSTLETQPPRTTESTLVTLVEKMLDRMDTMLNFITTLLQTVMPIKKND